MKKVVMLVLYLVLVTGICVGGYFLITNIITSQQGYLTFTVTDSLGNTVKTSKNNVLIAGDTYQFKTNYIYPDRESDGSEEYNVAIKSQSERIGDYYVNGQPMAYSGDDYSDEFKLVKKDNIFEFTVPALDGIFKDITDKDGNPIYLGELYDYDSFVLEVSSHDDKFTVEFAFHFTSKDDIPADSIDIGNGIFIHQSPSDEIYAIRLNGFNYDIYFGGDKVQGNSDKIYHIELGDKLGFTNKEDGYGDIYEIGIESGNIAFLPDKVEEGHADIYHIDFQSPGLGFRPEPTEGYGDIYHININDKGLAFRGE